MASWDEKYAGWKPIFEACQIQATKQLHFVKDGGPKVLTVCQGGNSRSVAAGFLLKYKYLVDAMACSWERNAPETIWMLCDWADTIILMSAEFVERIPQEFADKIKIAEVGHDRWCNGLHPELLKLVDGYLSQWFTVPECEF